MALSAGYDTTAHTLAWLLYHAAVQPELADAELRPLAVNEVLRLYPAGWLGSRRAAAGHRLRRHRRSPAARWCSTART